METTFCFLIITGLLSPDIEILNFLSKDNGIKKKNLVASETLSLKITFKGSGV